MAQAFNMRRHPRSGCEKVVSYCVQVNESGRFSYRPAQGRCIDVSDDGLGFYDPNGLEPGQIIRLTNSDGTYHLAVVRWADGKHGLHRVGVRKYQERFSARTQREEGACFRVQ